jgi:hypothetical protein
MREHLLRSAEEAYMAVCAADGAAAAARSPARASPHAVHLARLRSLAAEGSRMLQPAP